MKMKLMNFILNGFTFDRFLEDLAEFDFGQFIDEVFALDLGQYENLGFGEYAFVNLRQIIIGMVLGIILASYLTIFNRRVHGGFVRALIDENCSTPSSAKTLSELGFMKNSAVRGALRSGNTYRGIVRCVEAEDYYTSREQARGEYEARVAADGVKAPEFDSPEFKYDFTTAHFYIPEEKHFSSATRFEKKGTGILGALVITVVSIIMLWAILFFLPDILQMLDNFVGMLNN